MRTVLIIGASRGMGLHWVKHYKALGYHVTATTRNIAEAVELKALLAPEDKLLELDVTKPESVTAAISQFSEAPDLTIYNAGVKGYTAIPNVETTVFNVENIVGGPVAMEEGMKLAFEVNAFGLHRVLNGFKNMLIAKDNATVVYVSSGVADPAQCTSAAYPFYRQSKLAGESFARAHDNALAQEKDCDSRPRVFSIIP